jgi:hypothetical protein
VRVVVALIAFLAILWLGTAVLRALARPRPEAKPGEMRSVNLRYRCVICDLEVKMVRASEDLPPPPRHCLEDMELVAPVE